MLTRRPGPTGPTVSALGMGCTLRDRDRGSVGAVVDEGYPSAQLALLDSERR